jgi:hypothetical protein
MLDKKVYKLYRPFFLKEQRRAKKQKKIRKKESKR